MSNKAFVAASGGRTIPEPMTYATHRSDSEGQRLRIGFVAHQDAHRSEFLLGEREARLGSRRLRINTELWNSGQNAGAVGRTNASFVLNSKGGEGVCGPLAPVDACS
jgi:hypothetical protein